MTRLIDGRHSQAKPECRHTMKRGSAVSPAFATRYARVLRHTKTRSQPNPPSRRHWSQRLPLNRARAANMRIFRWWEHVVVHADHHRDENYRVVEKMNFNPCFRKRHLEKTHRHR